MDDLIGCWNGQLAPVDEIKVPVLDRAFLFGDGVYEVIRIYSGVLFHLEDHLARLEDSLNKLSIRGVDIDSVRKDLLSTVEANKRREGLAYLQVTRGSAPRTHHYPTQCTPNVFMYVMPFDDPYKHDRETGVSAVTHPDIRWGRNDIKATSLAANCMAAQYAKEHGCLEVVFIDRNNMMTEGSHTSLFGIKHGKLIVAPSSSNVLPGITKRQLLGLAETCQLPLDERRLQLEEVYELDEFFLAGTPEELIPIVKLNDKQIGTGAPGPVFDRLYKAFEESRNVHLASRTESSSAGKQ